MEMSNIENEMHYECSIEQISVLSKPVGLDILRYSKYRRIPKRNIRASREFLYIRFFS